MGASVTDGNCWRGRHKLRNDKYKQKLHSDTYPSLSAATSLPTELRPSHVTLWEEAAG